MQAGISHLPVKSDVPLDFTVGEAAEYNSACVNTLRRPARLYLASELRRMARAEDEYTCFTYLSRRYKDIWLAAADMIDPPDDGTGRR